MPALRRLELFLADPARDAVFRMDEDSELEKIARAGLLELISVDIHGASREKRISEANADRAALMKRRIREWSSGKCQVQWYVDGGKMVEFDGRRVVEGKAGEKFPDVVEGAQDSEDEEYDLDAEVNAIMEMWEDY